VRARDIEKFCLSLPGATVVEQWGGCHVFKVGGKMFAILGPKDDHVLQGLSLKVGEDSFHILVRAKNIIPAPYLARAKWVSLQRLDALGAKELKAYLSRAHAIIASKLPKKKRAELGVAISKRDEIFDPFA